MQVPIRLGLTGGIGSGKSTVASMLAELGAAVIDADAISRQTTGVAGAAIHDIALSFGREFITPDGALDRDRMRQLVFSDPQARARLQAIVHPLVADETARQAQVAIDSGHRLIVFDVPLLVESIRWRQRIDRVLVIDCTPEVQIQRTTRRDGLGRDVIERIMSSQATRETRLRAADVVIFNNSDSQPALALEVRQIARGFGL
jgi:dephospho-CoA kinase